MPHPLSGLFELLMARIRAIEEQVSTMRDEFEAMASNMREELYDVREMLDEADCEGRLGGMDGDE